MDEVEGAVVQSLKCVNGLTSDYRRQSTLLQSVSGYDVVRRNESICTAKDRKVGAKARRSLIPWHRDSIPCKTLAKNQ